MSWSMIEACMRKQGAIANGVVPTDYQTSDTLFHYPHGDHVDAEPAARLVPNLVLWTGFDHRLVLDLKEDDA